MNATRVYAGRPAGARRADRRERLLAAGLELLGTGGRDAMTVRAVCGHAGVTSRMFYEAFADTDALTVAVFDAVVGEARELLLAALADAAPDPAAQARAALQTFITALTDDPRRARVAVVEARANPALIARRAATMRDLTALIAAHGRATYRPPGEAAPLVDATATLLAGGLTELLVAWLDGGLAHTREALIDDCVALFMATVEGAVAVGAARTR